MAGPEGLDASSPIRVTGYAAAILGGKKVHLSISHLPKYATAIVVIED